MSAFMGEYLGFTLGDVHSSQLNITRISSSNRYSENLSPNFTDSTAAVPGGNGVYYWDTFHTQMNFTIDFAFDDLREEDLRKLRQIFSFRGIKPLIFDEYPYKKYYVKCSQPPVLKFIPFGELKTAINYKGEGSLSLVAFYPYAVSVQSNVIDSDNTVEINNIGDLEMPTKIYYTLSSENGLSTKLCLDGEKKLELKINANDIQSKNNQVDNGICIDMKTHLVEGMFGNQKSGLLYNSNIESGDFFLIPTGNHTLESMSIEENGTNPVWNQIVFNYIYY